MPGESRAREAQGRQAASHVVSKLKKENHRNLITFARAGAMHHKERMPRARRARTPMPIDPGPARPRTTCTSLGCGGCCVGGKPDKCFEDGVSTNRRHSARAPRATTRVR